MTAVIRVQPTADLRPEFAAWAVAQTPPVRTVSHVEFGVPAQMFTHMPEALLLGALVDGRRYISPDEDGAEGRPAPGAEPLGVAGPEPADDVRAEVEALVAARLPEAAQAGMTADEPAVDPAHTPADEADTSDRSDQSPEEDAAFECEACGRDFSTARGRDTHRRLAHPED